MPAGACPRTVRSTDPGTGMTPQTLRRKVHLMDVFEAVDSRISCRWFLDKPVDQTIVRELIAKAARAASGGNLQPWRVYALTGAPLAEIQRRGGQRKRGRGPPPAGPPNRAN